MEWVYSGRTDEPAVFEGDSLAKSEEPKRKLIDIFSSRAPVEEAVSEPEPEVEFYGDEDVIEERVSPIQAFETFAGKIFPTNQRSDFSGSIYAEAHDAPRHHSQKLPRLGKLQGSESRPERIARIRAEIDAMAAEASAEDIGEDSEAFAQLSALRNSLSSIEEKTRISTKLHPSIRKMPPQGDAAKAVDDGNEADGAVTLQMVLPNVSVMSSLERRVAAIEDFVGVSHLEDACNGTALGSMLEDVRDKLALVTDKDLPDRLKKDAQDIAAVLHKELQDEGGAQLLHTASTLEKMEKWEHVAETVPVVVERLRSLKRVQDEAVRFTATLDALGKQVDSIQLRRDTNSKLVDNVQRSLEANMKTVHENLNILNEKIAEIPKLE